MTLAEQAVASKTIKSILGQYAYAVIARTNRGFFAVDPQDMVVGRQLLTRGSYGEHEIAVLQQFLTAASTVLVVGAHIGVLVIPIAKCCKKVTAIEANPYTYRLLSLNLMLNGISNCHTINLAASDREETLDFLVHRANSGGSKRVPIIKDPMYYYDNPETIPVSAVGLDDYLSEKQFDLIIMDVEGSEYFALQGMQKLIAKSQVLQIEFLPHHLKHVSGVSVEAFLSVIAPHFATLTIPSKQLHVDQEGFLVALREMYHTGQGDDGIIFAKAAESRV